MEPSEWGARAPGDREARRTPWWRTSWRRGWPAWWTGPGPGSSVRWSRPSARPGRSRRHPPSSSSWECLTDGPEGGVESALRPYSYGTMTFPKAYRQEFPLQACWVWGGKRDMPTSYANFWIDFDEEKWKQSKQVRKWRYLKPGKWPLLVIQIEWIVKKN